MSPLLDVSSISPYIINQFNWRKKLAAAAEKKDFFPELRSTVNINRDERNRTSRSDRAKQLQETFFVNE